MRLLSAALATFAVAGLLFAGTANAVTNIGAPGYSSTTVDLVAAKKKAKKVVKKAKKAAKKAPKKVAKASKKSGPGLCGTAKYWDKKTHKCADATAKK